MKNKSSKTLCAIIVTSRILGMHKEESKKAMEELFIRRNNGDTFDYEDYIQEKIKDMPLPESSSSLKLLSNISRIGSLKDE